MQAKRCFCFCFHCYLIFSLINHPGVELHIVSTLTFWFWLAGVDSHRRAHTHTDTRNYTLSYGTLHCSRFMGLLTGFRRPSSSMDEPLSLSGELLFLYPFFLHFSVLSQSALAAEQGLSLLMPHAPLRQREQQGVIGGRCLGPANHRRPSRGCASEGHFSQL